MTAWSDLKNFHASDFMTAPSADSPAASTRAEKRKAFRLWWKVIVVPLALCVGVLGMLSFFQTHLIFPGQASQGRPEARVLAEPGTELVKLTTSQGDRVVALFGPALTPEGRPRPDSATRPTILFFYGNAMCLSTALENFERFRRLGANVMIPDYVGYGMSEGQAGESGCIATADAAFEHLRARQDIDPTKIVAAGWSLGGAVAIDLASRKPVAGLAAFSTFTRLTDLARLHFPLVPASLLLRHRFDSEQKIPNVTCPILIGHGRDDRLIPFSMADRLASAAKAPVTRLAVEGAGHNDFFLTGDTEIGDSLSRFLDALAAPAGSPRRP